MNVHIHAPPPSSVTARDDGDCPVRASDGLPCGGLRFLVKYFDWYDPEATCFHCGSRFGGGEGGRASVHRVRREWYAARGKASS